MQTSNNFNYRSLRQTLEMLDCSKFWLYKLINKGLIKAYYLDTDANGAPAGKPYFRIDQIEDLFFAKTIIEFEDE